MRASLRISAAARAGRLSSERLSQGTGAEPPGCLQLGVEAFCSGGRAQLREASGAAEGAELRRPEPPLAEPSAPSSQAVAGGDSSGTPSPVAGERDQTPPATPRVANLPADFVPPPAPPQPGGEGPAKQPPPAIPLPHFAARSSSAVGQRRGPPLSLLDAIRAAKATRHAGFDESLEAHIRLGIDPRRSDQIVRGAASLPFGTGKAVRVAVFADGAAAEEALAAGAEVVGAEDLIARVKESGGKLDFDKCVATPAMMKSLGQVARILGPRGLMPNPKLGTVTTKVGEAVRAAKRGRVDFRADKGGIVHAGLGKLSFPEEALRDNVAAFAAALLAAKPAGLKKSSRYAGYFSSFSLASTMGPGLRVQIPSVANAADELLRQQGGT